MSAEAIGWTFKHSPYSGTHLVVHLAIADVVNDGHDNQFFMAVDRLAAKTRSTRRTVQGALKQLVDDGYLHIVRPANQHNPTCYRFLFEPVRGAKVAPLDPGAQSTTPTRDATVRGANHDKPGAQSDAPRGAKSAPKPKEPKKNPKSSSSNETPPRPGTRPVDDDRDPRIIEASRLHAIEALDRRRQDELAGKQFSKIGLVENWLARTARNWIRDHRAAIAHVLATWPDLGAEDLLAHVSRLPSPPAEPQPPRRPKCAACAGSAHDCDDNGNVIDCPTCDGTGYAKAAA